MNEIAAARDAARRNWFAIAALWLAVASWIALVLRIMTWDGAGTNSTLGILFTIAMFGALVAAVAGLIAIRTRGDKWLAVTAFAASMLVPSGYLLLYALVAVFFGGLDEILD